MLKKDDKFHPCEVGTRANKFINILGGDETAFDEGRPASHFVGHWLFQPTYAGNIVVIGRQYCLYTQETGQQADRHRKKITFV